LTLRQFIVTGRLVELAVDPNGMLLPVRLLDRESASGSASARTHEAGEHRALSGIEIDDAVSTAEQVEL
jgi:hypothetical protein